MNKTIILRSGLLATALFLLCQLLPAQWTQKATFPGGGRQYSSFTAINGKGYIGFGNNNQQNDWWEYDPANNTWTQKASIPGTGGRAEMTCFTIGNKGYVGLGLGDNGTSNFFWEYDPTTNTWTRIADYPGVWVRLPFSFVIGDKAYVGSGAGSGVLPDFWEYDATNNVWTRKNDMPYAARRYAGLGFGIGNKGYAGVGVDTGSHVVSDFWEYDPSNDGWTQKADFGGGIRVNSLGFSSINKGYITTGHNNQGTFYNDFWEYDPATNVWSQKANYPGSPRFAGAGFAIGCSCYVGVGTDGSFNPQADFWQYTACSSLPFSATIAPVHVTCHGLSNGQATANPVGGTSPYTYKWQPGGQTSQTITALAAGNYSVTITDNTQDTASAPVAINQPVAISLVATNDTAVCEGNQVLLTATGANSFSWQPGSVLNTDTGTTVIVAPTAPVDIVVTGTVGICTTSDTISIGINVVADPVLTAGDSIICSGDSVQICAPEGYASYLWSTNTTGQCIDASQAGNYWLTVTAQNGCSRVSEHQPLAVYPVPSVSIIVTGDTLTSYGAVTYHWLLNGHDVEGATHPVFVAHQIGDYSVRITDINGCVTTSSPVHVLTGINELEMQSEVSVYPNPAAGQVMISMKNGRPLSAVRAINMLGQEVQVTTVTGGKTIITMDIQALPAGTYQLMLYSNGQYIGSKLLVCVSNNKN